jgi:hypothetical protein
MSDFNSVHEVLNVVRHKVALSDSHVLSVALSTSMSAMLPTALSAFGLAIAHIAV